MEINISEGNKLILEFMGIKPKKTGGWSYEDAPFFYCNYPTYDECLEAMISYVKYHSSWDWLMRVVEKINSMAIDDVGEVGVEISPGLTSILTSSDEVLIEGYSQREFIMQTFTVVVEFIKWYNNANNRRDS